jgi:hypothetical protein
MVLTFRSSVPETRVVIERSPDGRQRIGRAIQSGHSQRHWDLRVEHPSGKQFTGTFNGNGAEATVAVAEMLSRTEMEYIQDKGRGDRLEQPRFDYNRRLADDAAVAPVTFTSRKG